MDKVVAVALIIALAIGLGFLMSLPIMLLWNYCLVGAIAGVSEISWLQSWGIYILITFLFNTNAKSS